MLHQGKKRVGGGDSKKCIEKAVCHIFCLRLPYPKKKLWPWELHHVATSTYRADISVFSLEPLLSESFSSCTAAELKQICPNTYTNNFTILLFAGQNHGTYFGLYRIIPVWILDEPHEKPTDIAQAASSQSVQRSPRPAAQWNERVIKPSSHADAVSIANNTYLNFNPA